MSEYRYLFADLLTNQVLAELPLSGVRFGQELNTAGPFSGHLLLSGVNSYTLNVSNATQPGRTAVYVDRDGTLVWGGVLWSREYSSVEQKITFAAREFESYFEKRRINFDYNLDQNPIDQLTVVRDLFNYVQGLNASSTWYGNANANIGVQVPNITSGVQVTKFYNYYDLKPMTEAVYELSKSNTGFDWNIDVYYDSSYNITKILNLEYPRRGRIYSSTDSSSLMLEFPGQIIEYTYPEDGTAATNTMYGLGAGTGVGKLISTQTASDQITAGWPVLENSVSYTDYWDQTLLDSLTLSQLNAVKNPAVVMTVTVPTYIDPQLGSYKTGDDFRIRITDDRFPTTLDVVRRLSKYEVQVGDAGPERVVMSFVQTTN